MSDMKDLSAFIVNVYEIYYDLEDTVSFTSLIRSLMNTPKYTIMSKHPCPQSHPYC